MKKIRLIGARKYLQGHPVYVSKCVKYPIVFEGEDALMPLSKYEEDENLKKVFGNFKSEIIGE